MQFAADERTHSCKNSPFPLVLGTAVRASAWNDFYSRGNPHFLSKGLFKSLEPRIGELKRK
jgi:hypothetical protein